MGGLLSGSSGLLQRTLSLLKGRLATVAAVCGIIAGLAGVGRLLVDELVRKPAEEQRLSEQAQRAAEMFAKLQNIERDLEETRRRELERERLMAYIDSHGARSANIDITRLSILELQQRANLGDSRLAYEIQSFEYGGTEEAKLRLQDLANDKGQGTRREP